jgi:hypothetical protein
MSNMERRSGKNRRTDKPRRNRNAPDYNGAERRSSRYERLGKDRRKTD